MGGHEVHIERMEPAAWLDASRHSFATGETQRLAGMLEAIVDTEP